MSVFAQKTQEPPKATEKTQEITLTNRVTQLGSDMTKTWRDLRGRTQNMENANKGLDNLINDVNDLTKRVKTAGAATKEYH